MQVIKAYQFYLLFSPIQLLYNLFLHPIPLDLVAVNKWVVNVHGRQHEKITVKINKKIVKNLALYYDAVFTDNKTLISLPETVQCRCHVLHKRHIKDVV